MSINKKYIVLIIIFILTIFTPYTFAAIPEIDLTGIATGTDTVHSHVYERKFDENYHWEQCVICNNVRNKVAHTKQTDTLYPGVAGCYHTNRYTTYCTANCGYTKNWKDDHTWPQVVNYGITFEADWAHITHCAVCGDWVKSEGCRKADGSRITCNNLGTCATCGHTWDYKEHYCYKGNTATGVNYTVTSSCNICQTQMATFKLTAVTYSADRQTCTVVMNMKPILNCTPDYLWAFITEGGISLPSYTISNRKADGSYDLTWVYQNTHNTFTNKTLQCRVRLKDASGKYIYIYPMIVRYEPDLTAPTIASIRQTNNQTYNNWTVSKTITVTGAEAYSDFVWVKLTDKNGNVMFNYSGAKVNNGQYSYSFTPRIEADNANTEFYIYVKDRVGNERRSSLYVMKTDSRPPTLVSTQYYETKYRKEETVTFQLKDVGVRTE